MREILINHELKRITEIKEMEMGKKMESINKQCVEISPFNEFEKYQNDKFEKFVENRISMFKSEVENIKQNACLKQNVYLKYYNQLSELSNSINDASNACEEALLKLSRI